MRSTKLLSLSALSLPLLLLLPLLTEGANSNSNDNADNKESLQFCEQFAECRSGARKQFEQCVGGFTQMVIAESEGLKTKTEGLSPKCEKELIESIEREIRPFYEMIEQDTFACARTADPVAFNLDEMQRLRCKSVQHELNGSSFAITGVLSDTECRSAYESQLKRCDLVKECCPQFGHCRMQAELQNNGVGKEERVAKQLEDCLGRQNVDFHESPTSTAASSSSTTAEKSEIPEAEEAAAHTTPKEKRKAPEPFPPAEKAFSDLVGLLFPHLTTTTVPPPSAAPVVTYAATKHRQPSTLATLPPVSAQSDSAPKNHERRDIPWNQIALWKQKSEKLEQLERSRTAGASAPTTAVANEASTSPSPSPTPTPTPTTPEAAADPAKAVAALLKSAENAPISSSESTFSVDEREALSRVFCEEFMDCEYVVARQFKLCDERYQPEEALYGVQDQELRQQFLANSHVTDDKVKRRCMESVDPESQRQLGMLKLLVEDQNRKCTRATTAHSTSSKVMDSCMNERIITIVSDLFTQNEIPRDKTPENAEKCYSRVQELHGHCLKLRKCCPQSFVCETSNKSVQHAKYQEIVDQLKEEQTLCEKRRMRILNGLV